METVLVSIPICEIKNKKSGIGHQIRYLNIIERYGTLLHYCLLLHVFTFTFYFFLPFLQDTGTMAFTWRG